MGTDVIDNPQCVQCFTDSPPGVTSVVEAGMVVFYSLVSLPSVCESYLGSFYTEQFQHLSPQEFLIQLVWVTVRHSYF